MKARFALLFLLGLFAVAQAQAQQREYIIPRRGPAPSMGAIQAPTARSLVGKFRPFRAGRTEQLRAQLGPNALITWLVYKPGYIDRGRQEKTGSDREHQQRARQIWSQAGLLRSRRRRHQLPEQRDAARPGEDSGFEFFGHSNKACFLFDYSNIVTAPRRRGCTRLS
jgi:hypothetical protein